MSNTRKSPTGEAIGDPEGDLDHVPRGRGLGPLAAKAEAKRTAGERFKEKFSWAPHWKGEVTLALEGLGSRVNKGGRQHPGAVRKTLSQADGYKLEALRDATLLRKAFIVPEEMSTLSPDEIRDNPHILRILAKHKLFGGSLATGKWPAHKNETLEPKLKPIATELIVFDDQALSDLWHETFTSANERAQFWIGQLNSVSDNPWVIEARREEHQRMIS